MMLSGVLTSCYPPRILYSIEGIRPSLKQDSVDVQLIKGSTITTGGLSLHLSLYLEISNKKESSILINRNSILELRTDSVILKYEISPDSLVYQLRENENKLLHLYFHTTDFEYATYKTVDTNHQHKLFLFLDLRDDEDKQIEKCVILKPTGVKRMKFETPPF